MNHKTNTNNYYQLETFNYELMKMCTKKFYIDHIKDNRKSAETQGYVLIAILYLTKLV